MNWTQLLTTEIERTYTTAARLMERVDPDGLDWKPATGGDWMTVGQLLKHIGTACGAGCRGLATGDWGLPPGVKIENLSAEEPLPPADRLPSIGSIGEARKLLLEDKAIALQTIGQIGEDGLGAREVAPPWAPDEFSVLGRLSLQMVQHLERHKAQLFYYLKLQGKPVNTADLWGP